MPATLYVCLDFETSGIAPLHARALQVGACATLHRDGAPRVEVLAQFASDARPVTEAAPHALVAVSAAARRAHNISDARIRAAPPLERVLKRLAAWLHEMCAEHGDVDACVLLAHNGFSFDFPLLFAELERLPMHPRALVPPHVHLFFADTLFAWRRHAPFGQGAPLRLAMLFKHAFGGAVKFAAHDALADVLALERLVFARNGAPLAAALHEARSLNAQIARFEARADREATRLARFESVDEYARAYAAPEHAQRLYGAMLRITLRPRAAPAAVRIAGAPTASTYFAESEGAKENETAAK